MTEYILYFVIVLFASVIGGICGIGGGVIIKPVLDTLKMAPVAAINFMSACTVFTMSLYNVLRSLSDEEKTIDVKSGTPLAVGAAIGGIAGNLIFTLVLKKYSNETAGAAQAVILFVLVALTLVYTLNKSRIRPIMLNGPLACTVTGLGLGTVSSLLGIGGGPFNLVVMHYFLGVGTKQAVDNSLYVILFGQAANILLTVFSGKIPEVQGAALASVILGGLMGGIIGRSAKNRLSGIIIDKLFAALTVVIMIICVRNFAVFAF